jgi:cell division protein FtsL
VAKGVKWFSGGTRIEARPGKTSQHTVTRGSKIIIIIIIIIIITIIIIIIIIVKLKR